MIYLDKTVHTSNSKMDQSKSKINLLVLFKAAFFSLKP